MKKIYNHPEILIESMDMESQILDLSKFSIIDEIPDEGDTYQGAKSFHNPEEETNLPKSSTLWDEE